MPKSDELKQRIFDVIGGMVPQKPFPVSEDTPLIGDGSVLDSMTLVELCLKLEDMATALGFEFDWTSDTAMSKSRSMFRSAGALATEFLFQMETKK